MNQLKRQMQEAESVGAVVELNEEAEPVKWDLGLFFGFFLWLLIVTIGYWCYRSGILLLGA